jgi:hypothetical protein
MISDNARRFFLYINATQLPPYAMRTYLHVGEHIAQSSPEFLDTGLDLCWGKDKAVGSRVAHLNRHGVLCLGNLIRVIDRVARDCVDGGADGAGLVGQAVGSLDSGNGAGDERFVGSRFGNDAGAGVSVGFNRVSIFLIVDGRLSGNLRYIQSCE